jgi:hypothetical protein
MKTLKNLVLAAVFCMVLALVFGAGTQMPRILALAVPAEPTPVETSPLETKPADNADKERIAQLEAQVTELSRDKERLTEEVERYRAQAEETCVLVLRYEELFLSGIFGDAFVIERAVQEIAVSRDLYDSCRTGDDITSLELHRLMTCSGLSDTRVIVENKYIRT